ncbi:MAG TPA: hypothetical protein VFW47_07145 [Phenylobacterium sp.]|nr:hypothetical protein [Phenylobacterium sp.]
MAVIFGRFRSQSSGYWAVQLRRGEVRTAVAGRYVCHERDAAGARVAASRLAKRHGMSDFTLVQVSLPVHGFGDADLPEIGSHREVTNLFLWSKVLDARQDTA